MLRRMFETKRVQATGDWIKLRNGEFGEFRNLYILFAECDYGDRIKEG